MRGRSSNIPCADAAGQLREKGSIFSGLDMQESHLAL